MAVYTKLEESEMREVINLYEVGNLVSFTGITKGIMNSNYLIKTDSGKYILRIIEMDREIEEEQKELKFLEYISSHNIPCPGVVITKKGEDYIFIKGKMASLFTFLEGKEVLDINSEILYKFGKILAKMHNLSNGMNLTRNEKIELEYLYDFIAADDKKLKDILAIAKLPKATYMYWQGRFNRTSPDAQLEKKIKAIRQRDKDFGYHFQFWQ